MHGVISFSEQCRNLGIGALAQFVLSDWQDYPTLVTELRKPSTVLYPTTTSPSGFIQHKRSVGCSQIDASNTSTYNADGGTFEVFCDTAWHVANAMYLTYTVDFASCMNECVVWNRLYSVKCVGVGWGYGVYGPGGVAGGSSCTFLWNMVLSQGFEQTGADSARLQGVPLPIVLQAMKIL